MGMGEVGRLCSGCGGHHYELNRYMDREGTHDSYDE